jgi:hypothetical protein
MSDKPHIVRIVADEARRQYYRRHCSRAELPKPRICQDEIGVEFEDGRFIPYADLGYNDDVGFFRLSEASGVASEAAPFAAAGRLIDCGQVVVTTGIAQRLTPPEIRDLLERHAGGDFGLYGEFYDLDVSDAMLLNAASQPLSLGLVNKVNTLTGLNPIISTYTVREHLVWIITEAGEKRTTMMLYAGLAED